jgi:axin 1
MLDDDKDDQDILDQHVSRVWSDMTPHRSGDLSPCNQFQRRKPGHEMAFVAGGSKKIILKLFSVRFIIK